MSPDLSRRLGTVLGSYPVTMAERLQLIAAANGAGTWDNLPSTARQLIAEIRQRAGWTDSPRPRAA